MVIHYISRNKCITINRCKTKSFPKPQSCILCAKLQSSTLKKYGIALFHNFFPLLPVHLTFFFSFILKNLYFHCIENMYKSQIYCFFQQKRSKAKHPYSCINNYSCSTTDFKTLPILSFIATFAKWS